MKVLHLILYLIACICFALAALGTKVPTRINLLAIGLLAWVLVPTTAHIDSL